MFVRNVRSHCSSSISVIDVLVLLERGVVHQDVEAAVVFERLVDQPVAGGALAQIAGEELAELPFLTDEVCGDLGVLLFGWQVVDRDARPFASEQHGRSAADARISASNECNFATQFP